MPRLRLEDLAGYEVDVDGHIGLLAQYLLARNQSLSEFAIGQHKLWLNFVEEHQAGNSNIALLSILHARLQYLKEGTEPEPEELVAYFAHELGNIILRREFGTGNGES